MSHLEFTVNGKKCFVFQNCVHRDMTLNAYLRYELNLPGTKAMCREGGCGACLVAVSAPRYPSGDVETFSVNSCLVLVYSCHNWSITTIEGVGNRKEGYSEVQKRITKLNGTQCGYCTPGWVIHMHSLLDKNLTMAELEKSFGSNTCRCTGYRPILDTVKSFATNPNSKCMEKIKDIEDLSICKNTNKLCDKTCHDNDEDDWVLLEEIKRPVVMDIGDSKYYKTYEIDQIFNALKNEGTESYMFVDGNTGKGLYEKFEYPNVLIDISDVKELKTYKLDQNLIIGANMSLDAAMTLFVKISNENSDFAYLKVFAEHIEKVAHMPVRKLGSLAGNITLKKIKPSYQSDIFLLFQCVRAMVTVQNNVGEQPTLSLLDFLKYEMKGKLMINIILPPLGSNSIIQSYKIMPRNQNALAILNAAFLLNIDRQNGLIDKASIVFGNISSTFHNASNTEAYLKGTNVFNNVSLQKAINSINSELAPEDQPVKILPKYRKILAIGLFYKFILGRCPINININDRYKSGGAIIQRPVSHGTQDFQTDPTLYPLNEPVTKLEGLIQSSGEARYANDIPNLPGQVFGAFVLATIHSGDIDNIDAKEVLKIPGVRALYTAKDIPGKNSFIVIGINDYTTANIEILASSKIQFYGQPIAIVVANTEALAFKVATEVTVTYKNICKEDPILTINQAKVDSTRLISGPSLRPKNKGRDVRKIVKGVYEIDSQYYYYMELITCVVVPIDNGIEVYDSTQYMGITQAAIAQALKMKESNIYVKMRRVGGAFGGKISASCRASTACALVATKLNLPCRFLLPMQTNMTIVGKRSPCQTEYEVGVDDEGNIQYLNANIIENQGSVNNENVLSNALEAFSNCYKKDTWSVNTSLVLTDLPANTFMRAPGSCEGISTIEHILEHIAFEVRKDPTDVRISNMRTEDNDLPEMIEILKKDSQYNQRYDAIQKFNKANRWMKKAIQISVMSFPIEHFYNFHAIVSIYREDGTVNISTGGIEIGQGLNTKAAQVCAYTLGIPLDFVSVIPSDVFIAANDSNTASSVTSETVCYSVQKACEILNKRLQPLKEKMGNPTWVELIKNSEKDEIDLTAIFMNKKKEPIWDNYHAFAVAILEVQLDVLTGRYEILRVDILEDVGLSTNPNIDIGQIEGAYIQGLGYFTSEKLVFDKKSGKLLTNRSLTYHVPLALDIPVDFRVSLKRNTKNPKGAVGTKGVGECGICIAHGIQHALRQCIMESRKESGHDPDLWINIDSPYDTESILKALEVKTEEFLIT